MVEGDSASNVKGIPEKLSSLLNEGEYLTPLNWKVV